MEHADSYAKTRNCACNGRIIEGIIARKLCDRLMLQATNLFKQQFVGSYTYAIFFHGNKAPSQSVGPRAHSGSGIWRIPRGTAVSHDRRIVGRAKAWGQGRAIAVSVLFCVCARVGVRIEEARHFFLLMRHRAVPYQGKPKSVVAIEGSTGQRDVFARAGLAHYTAPSVKERAALKLQTTWNKIHQQWLLWWMDKWYNKQFTTNPDNNDKSLNATAFAVLLLRDAPHYWHGHPSLEELERCFLTVTRMLGNTEGTFARILRDLGFASRRPVARNIRAPLDIIRPVSAKRPH